MSSDNDQAPERDEHQSMLPLEGDETVNAARSQAAESTPEPTGDKSVDMSPVELGSEADDALEPADAGDLRTTQAAPVVPNSPPVDEPADAGDLGTTQAAPVVPNSPPPIAKRPTGSSIREGHLTVEQHLETVLRGVGPLAPYDQPLVESLGLPLHDDFTSPHDLPRFDNSSMDGYAVVASDVAAATRANPVLLPVVGEIAAGSARPFAISPGSAVKIMTGAPIPKGADTIVPIEATDQGKSRVSIYRAIPAHTYIRPRAGDVKAGDVVVKAGTVLGPREIGLIAALGAGRVKARPRPRVVVMSTGSELREPGGHLEYDSIFDGNSFMLAAACRAAGAIAYRVPAIKDNPREFRRALSDQLVRADLVVTSGGISKGDHDVVKEALAPLGTVTFSEVAMQPGKPQGFGTVFEEQTPIITLPGNSVSAYVSFEVFVLPAIRRMMGLTPYRRPMVHAVLAADVQSPAGKRQFLRGVFEVTHRGAKVTPNEGAGSHLIGGLAGANALIIVGEDETALNMGDTVRTLVLDRPF